MAILKVHYNHKKNQFIECKLSLNIVDTLGRKTMCPNLNRRASRDPDFNAQTLRALKRPTLLNIGSISNMAKLIFTLAQKIVTVIGCQCPVR